MVAWSSASALMGVLSDHDVCSIASLSSLPLGLVLAANFPNPFSVLFPVLLCMFCAASSFSLLLLVAFFHFSVRV